MPEWEDYYQRLDVDPEASEEEIKKAYRYKTFILHPDRLGGNPEVVRHRAEEELKKVNKAYAVIGDPQRRQSYHSEWLKKKDIYSIPKPKPVVNPQYIRFEDVKPGELKKASFIILNMGGPYTRIWISNPDSWLRVVSWTSVTDDELPLKVNIEVEARDWGKSYSEYIKIKLDEEEAEAKVELETKPEFVREKVGVGGIPGSKSIPSAPSSFAAKHRFPAWAKWVVALVGLALLIVVLVGQFSLLTKGPRNAVLVTEFIYKQTRRAGETHVFIKRFADGTIYSTRGGMLEVPFTDFAFLVDFNLPVKRENSDTLKKYNNRDNKWRSIQVSVFAKKMKHWRRWKPQTNTIPIEYLPEFNSVNKVPAKVNILDKERILVSPVQGNFPQGSQIVIEIRFSSTGGHLQRVFTNPSIRKPLKW